MNTHILLYYFVIAGLLCYLKVSQLPRKIEDGTADDVYDILSQIYVQTGMKLDELLPILQALALLMGWILIPIAIVQKIIDLFEK